MMTKKSTTLLPYFQLLAASLMWSVVGLLVKYSVVMVNSHFISFFRFFFGVMFLLLFMKLTGVKISLSLRHPLVWIAALGKTINYLFENLGIENGPAWGNIIVGPVQMVMLGVLSALFLKERVTPRKIGAVILTILGVSLLRAKSGEAGLTHAIILMMIFSGIGAAVHVFLQRRLVESMDSLNLNTSVFIAASLITLLPLPVLGHFTGQFSFAALFSLLGLGLITGLSFHLFALALRSVPIIRVTILSNVGFLFTPIWAWLAFSDPLSLRVLFGAALSISGIVLVSLPGRRALPPVD